MKNQTITDTPVPSGFINYGQGPLKVQAAGKQIHDVIGRSLGGSNWTNDLIGWGSETYYALRKNSEIAKLNGLTNTESMKTQPHTKQMKLKLQVLNSDEIQVPSGMVAFRIVEQDGFEYRKIYTANEYDFQSVFLPDFDDGAYPRTRFYVCGGHKDQNNRIMVIPRVKYERLVTAIDSLLKKENAPKILYTATFFYKNEKNGSQKRRMIEVLTENDTHLAGNDKDDDGKYKNFLKANVIGAVDKVKS